MSCRWRKNKEMENVCCCWSILNCVILDLVTALVLAVLFCTLNNVWCFWWSSARCDKIFNSICRLWTINKLRVSIGQYSVQRYPSISGLSTYGSLLRTVWSSSPGGEGVVWSWWARYWYYYFYSLHPSHQQICILLSHFSTLFSF